MYREQKLLYQKPIRINLDFIVAYSRITSYETNKDKKFKSWSCIKNPATPQNAVA